MILAKVEETQTGIEAAAVRHVRRRGLAGVPFSNLRQSVARGFELLGPHGEIEHHPRVRLLGGRVLLVDVDR